MEKFGAIRNRLLSTVLASVSLLSWQNSVLAETSPEEKEKITETRRRMEASDSLLQGLTIFEQGAQNVKPEIAAAFVEGKTQGKGKWFLLSKPEAVDEENASVDFGELQDYLDKATDDEKKQIRFVHSHPDALKRHKTDVSFEKDGQKFATANMIPSLQDYDSLMQKIIVMDKETPIQELIYAERTQEYVEFSVDESKQLVSDVLKSENAAEGSKKFETELINNAPFARSILLFGKNMETGDQAKARENLERMLQGFDENGLKFRIIPKIEMIK
ncbi:MAG: hypothetical protein V4469_00450 [Patescibacteria group bacterium]